MICTVSDSSSTTTESMAANAPSVEAIGATTPTLPIRSARYIDERPSADAAPAVTAQAQPVPVAGGSPSSATAAMPVATSPISIT